MSESVDHPFAIVPARMLNEVKASSVVVYAVLAEHANADQESWPSIGRIAKRAGLTDGTVRAACKELEAAGWLTVRGRATDEGRQTSNLYKIRRVRNSDVVPPQKTQPSPHRNQNPPPSKNRRGTIPTELNPSNKGGSAKMNYPDVDETKDMLDEYRTAGDGTDQAGSVRHLRAVDSVRDGRPAGGDDD